MRHRNIRSLKNAVLRNPTETRDPVLEISQRRRSESLIGFLEWIASHLAYPYSKTVANCFTHALPALVAQCGVEILRLEALGRSSPRRICMGACERASMQGLE